MLAVNMTFASKLHQSGNIYNPIIRLFLLNILKNVVINK